MNWRQIYDLVEDYLTGVLLITGLGIVLAGVFMRYVLNAPLFWADEIGNYFVIWGALLGTSVALREDKHIRVKILYNLLPLKAQRWVSIFSEAVGLGFCVFFTIGGFILVGKYLQIGQVSLNSQTPLWIPYLIAPITGMLFGLRFADNLLRLLFSKRT
ncbi:MAG: C4-dicarboxylate transporter, DctQ subunit [Clostridia bacterium]|nr:C4-dicarboxylate transporter, DctQ subunit [Clostridia bacterium]